MTHTTPPGASPRTGWCFFLALALVPVLLSFVRSPATPGLGWWTTHALDKVRPYDRPDADAAHAVQIHAARNEFESFQIVLRADGEDGVITDVDVTDLHGPGGAIIPKRDTTIYLERYLNIATPSSIDGGAGEWPDALVPRVDRYKGEKRNAFPFKIPKGRNQPVWMDVYVPPGAPPGKYHGEVQVRIPGKPELNIPLDLEVWSFELPSTSTLVNTFGFSGMGALRAHRGWYTNDRDLYDLTFTYRKAALWHRITLHGGSGIPPASTRAGGRLQLQWKRFDDEIGPFMDGRVFAPDEPLPGAKATAALVATPAAFQTEDDRLQYWQQVGRHFREKGWMDRLVHYLWDEPKRDDYAALARLGEVVRRADPEVRNLVTAPLRPEWMDFIGIWSPIINCVHEKPGKERYCLEAADRQAYDGELARGKQLWWYQSCGSHGCNIVGGDYFSGWPSIMVDHNGVRNRIMEWLTWKYGIQGELYFNTVEAYLRRDPWKDLRLFGGNGDGTLFYPGRPDVIGGSTHIPIESIRLKLIREGLEDYEYLAMLSESDGRRAAADLVNTFIRTAYDFDQDPRKLYAVRDEIGRRLGRR